MNGSDRHEPVWVALFFEALKVADEKGRPNASKAADRAGVNRSLVYRRRQQDEDFRIRWDETVLLCLENERQRRLRKLRYALAIE